MAIFWEVARRQPRHRRGFPAATPQRCRSAALRGVVILRDYTVQAWAELTHPEHRIIAWSPSPGRTRPPAREPDEILILITRRMQGY